MSESAHSWVLNPHSSIIISLSNHAKLYSIFDVAKYEMGTLAVSPILVLIK
jgi:hypothetical protein